VTERWRKKLEGIDQVGPSDDVYQRAKSGPSLPEPQSPMQRTSTRVVTAIAAFVVFALAISVFAIPALRLGNKESFVPGGDQLQPLWPWSSIDAVHAWRDDPQPIGATSVDHFSSPDDVAAAFGRDVLGWSEVYPHEEGTPQTYPCPGPTPGYTNMSPPPTVINACSVVYGGGSVPPTIALYGSISSPPGFRTFDLSTCPANVVCDSSGAPPSSVKVVVYQPLGGEGPWAVLEAKTEYISISLDPGTQLRDGSIAYASGLIPTGEHAVLGYHATADGCGDHTDTTAFERVGTDAASDQTSGGISLGSYSRGQLQFTLPPQSDACREQAGYVFVAITDHALSTTDPLAGVPVTAGVLGFAAVPVSFVFQSQDAGSPPPSSSLSPSPIGAPAHGYTDPLGWTIDVPDGWSAHPIEMGTADESWRGAWFGTGQPADVVPDPNRMTPRPGDVMLILDRHEHVGSSSPGDDSSLPLTFKQLASVDGGYRLDFRADGQPFTLSVRADSDGLTDQQRATVESIVASIHFQPWEPGEARDGWTAVGRVLPSASAQWVMFESEHWYATYDSEGRRLFVGPAPNCSTGGSYEVRETGVVGITCPDGTGGEWDLQGHPRPQNSPGFDVALDGYSAILAWDGGTLLANLPLPN
jgi:hypothetical protein